MCALPPRCRRHAATHSPPSDHLAAARARRHRRRRPLVPRPAVHKPRRARETAASRTERCQGEPPLSPASRAPAPPSSPAARGVQPPQIVYPAPTPFSCTSDADVAALRAAWKGFFAQHGKGLGVVVVEPQWGSSCAAATWPKELLKEFIGLAHAAGALVVSDEVMCGLARHGEGGGKCFLSDAWGLQPDCLTFGKAVATGMFPLAGGSLRRVAPLDRSANAPPAFRFTRCAGAIITRGAAALGADGRSVAQSHTYAASSPRALMAATLVSRAWRL